MTYVLWILYILLIVVLIGLILLIVRLYKISNRVDLVLTELEETLKSLNSDLPVILENLRDVSEEARETTKITRMAVKKAKDQILWINMVKEAIGMFMQFRKKGGKKDE